MGSNSRPRRRQNRNLLRFRHRLRALTGETAPARRSAPGQKHRYTRNYDRRQPTAITYRASRTSSGASSLSQDQDDHRPERQWTGLKGKELRWLLPCGSLGTSERFGQRRSGEHRTPAGARKTPIHDDFRGNNDPRQRRASTRRRNKLLMQLNLNPFSENALWRMRRRKRDNLRLAGVERYSPCARVCLP